MAGLDLKQNKTKFLLAPFLMLVLVGMGVGNAYAMTASDTIKGLGMPDITINPESGSVGTEVTINVSNLPMPPDGADPRLEFYMYLPASEEYGATLTECGGHCMVLYSFEEIRNKEVSPKEITFALPSVKNPESSSVQLSESFKESGTKQGATISSVCDVVINGEIEYRFGYSCNNHDAPVGEYEIKFGWAVGVADIYDKRQSVTFTVTDESTQQNGISSTELTGDHSDMIFKKYEQGEMTIKEFVTALQNQGSWESEADMRRALSVVGELAHQEGPWVDTIPVTNFPGNPQIVMTNESTQQNGISSTELTGDHSDMIFKKYEQGEMTMTEFIAALQNQGSWGTDADIRKALSLVGELDHQKGVTWVDANSKAESLVSVVDNNSKAKSVIPVADTNSGASISKASSEIDDASSTIVYAVVIGGVIIGGAIVAAFGRNIF